MLKQIILSVIIIVSVVIGSYATSPSNSQISGSKSTEITTRDMEKAIFLYGQLFSGGVRASDIIDAYISSATLRVEFRDIIGNVEVEIVNSSGNLVYDTVVNTVLEERLIVPVAGWTSDTYTVYFIASHGTGYCSFTR